MRASDPSPAPDPMKRRRLRTQSMEEAGGIFLCAASWPSPSLDPLYIAELGPTRSPRTVRVAEKILALSFELRSTRGSGNIVQEGLLFD